GSPEKPRAPDSGSPILRARGSHGYVCGLLRPAEPGGQRGRLTPSPRSGRRPVGKGPTGSTDAAGGGGAHVHAHVAAPTNPRPDRRRAAGHDLATWAGGLS